MASGDGVVARTTKKAVGGSASAAPAGAGRTRYTPLRPAGATETGTATGHPHPVSGASSGIGSAAAVTSAARHTTSGSKPSRTTSIETVAVVADRWIVTTPPGRTDCGWQYAIARRPPGNTRAA